MNFKSAKFKFTAILFVVMMIISQTGCGNKTDVENTGEYFDTEVTLTIYDIDENKGNDVLDGCFELCEKYENLLSKTVSGSDVDRINRAKGRWTEIDPDTVDVIKTGIDISERSEGLFDITVGRLTDIWDFEAEDPKVPSEDEVKDARDTVDYRQIKIRGNKVRLGNSEAKIDLGGIAKGYIADRLTEFMKKEGVEHAVINLGGNVAVVGEKSDGSAWNIGVERPYSERTEIIGAVPVRDQTIVTSGIYERYFEVDGKKYNHIIDPRTGWPVESDVELVTITGESGSSMVCDGLSSACILLGREDGMKLIEKEKGKEALFADKDDKVTKTKGMKFDEIKQEK